MHIGMSMDSTLFGIGHLPYDKTMIWHSQIIFFAVHLCGCIQQAAITLSCIPTVLHSGRGNPVILKYLRKR